MARDERLAADEALLAVLERLERAHCLTPEQVRHSLLGAFAKRCMTGEHWKDIPTEDFYTFVDDCLCRLTGGDPPGQRTTQPG